MTGGGAAALLVGAGSGTRLGAGGPKAFVRIAGEPLLLHAARALAAADAIGALVAVVGRADVARARALLGPAVEGVPVTVVAGGRERADSVRAGLAALRGADVIAVHDAARPLVTPALVDRVVNALVAPWAAVAPGLPVVDTVKLVDGERVVRTVDRRALQGVQTPQVFARATLEAVHTRLTAPAAEATDDLVLVERAGGRVRVVPGERRNLKVTFPEDVRIAEALLAGVPG